MTTSRRQVLKVLAAAPLLLPLVLTASPVMRYLKPTMGPLGFFDSADLPDGNVEISFKRSDFPKPWVCLPFQFPMKISVFNPEHKEVREIPAFIFRLPNNKFVAYSRICPGRRGILNLVSPDEYNKWLKGPIREELHPVEVRNPVLYCCCDICTFDLAKDGRVLRGRAQRPPYKFELDVRQDKIIVVRPEPGRIY